MSDINNNEQTNIWATGTNNVKPAFSANQGENTGDAVYVAEKEVTRKSLYDMNALSGQSMIKSKQVRFTGNYTLEDKETGINIAPERLATVTEDLKPFLRERPSVVMRATALGDFAFGSAVKENLTDPYAKTALIQFAAANELADAAQGN